MADVSIWAPYSTVTPRIAVELEALGYAGLWLGMSPPAPLEIVEQVLAATHGLPVGTSIVNVWSEPAKEIADAYHRLEAAYPGRFTLGIGAGHPEVVTGYAKPYDALVAYLDELDTYGVPTQRRAMAALGPRMLELARTRTAGALPYLVTPDHTRSARAALGPDALLVVEQKVVLEDDPERGRALGRQRLGLTLQLTNYAGSLRRQGFNDDDLAAPGSDRIIDALAVHGSAQEIVDGLRAHLDAGANQVAVQVISDDPDEGVLRVARALAGLI